MAKANENHLQPYGGDGPYVFVCYSHADREVLDQIHWLQEQGVNIWYDTGITPGSEWTEALAERIQGCSQFLYFLSKNSSESEHCRRELRFAQDEEKQILVVQLEPFELPPGLRLSLRNRQLIQRFELRGSEYQSQLSAVLQQRLDLGQPVPISKGRPSSWPWLRGVVTLAIVLTVLVVIVALWRHDNKPLRGHAYRPTIAVLPFDNMSGDPEQDYFVDGMTEEIITRLSMSKGLYVIARNSSFSYRGKQLKVSEIANELQADFIVEGSVRRSGDRTRVTAQMIDAETDSHLWADNFEGDNSDVFALQDQLAVRVATSVVTASGLAETLRARRTPTKDLSAYDFLLRGNDCLWNRNKASNQKAREFYERAIELDPLFVAAYSGLGITYLRDFYSTGDPSGIERASELAEKALSIDDSLPDAHVLLGSVYMLSGERDRAAAAARRVLSLDPNRVDAYVLLANSMTAGQECLDVLNEAMRLNPLHTAPYLQTRSRIYLYMGQLQEAIADMEQVLAKNPDSPVAHFHLAYDYRKRWELQQTDDPEILDKALQMAQRAVTLNQADQWGQWNLSACHLWRKEYDEALASAERALELIPKALTVTRQMGAVLTAIGRHQEAIEILSVFPDAVELGTAYRLSGKNLEAEAVLGRVTSDGVPFEEVWQSIQLAILYSETSRLDEAEAQAAEILRHIPNFSVDTWGERIPMKDREQVERDMAALRNAGLK